MFKSDQGSAERNSLNLEAIQIPIYSVMDSWWYIHIIKYNPETRKNKLQLHIGIWMNSQT